MKSPRTIKAGKRMAFLLAGILLLTLLSPVSAEDSPPKVVVLGFDGADPVLIRKYMDEGLMPNFKKLSEMGGARDLNVTNPPQTPVSWASFMTSWNPGRTQIFDFLKRDVKTYKPSFALMGEESRPLLFGANNRWALPLIGFLAALALPLIIWAVFRRGRKWIWMTTSIGCALVAGGALFWLASLLPNRIPEAINNVQGEAFWETAAAQGKRALVFRIPGTFPAKAFPKGRLLSGLGVPDMRGRVGTPYMFTTDNSLMVGENEFSVEVVFLDFTQIPDFETTIVGPSNKPFYDFALEDAADKCADPEALKKLREEMTTRLEEKGVHKSIDVPLAIHWDEAEGTAAFTVQGQTQTLKPGEWSEWQVLEFQFNPIVKLKGIVRFYLLSASPNLSLYMSPIHIHPENHAIPISYPSDYAEELLHRFGFYKTMGWAVDTWTISSGLADETQFLSDMYLTVDAYQNMMRQLLRDGDWDLYVQMFEYTDRIGHILWRYLDPEHPLYDAEKAPIFEEEMRKAYVRMDSILGEAMEILDPETRLLVLSDHGFASFRKGVNYNRWLIDNGYMTLKGETGVMTLYDLFDDDRLLFKNVDWSRTRVYALGLGNLYVNVKGRERDGIVEPGEEYDALVAEIKERLPLLEDPETGERPVHAVYHRDDIYRDYDPDLVPDMRVTNPPGYRVSWQTSLGGAPEKIVQDNLRAWSGDHCSMDPEFVPGMFYCNFPIRESADILDMGPTVLSLLGVDVPEVMEGKPLQTEP